MATAEHVAHEFWSALCLRDLARAGALLGEGAVFQPAGMPASRGGAVLGAFLGAAGDEIGSALETVASYDDMIIAERIGRVVGAPVGRQQLILSLVRVRDGRVVHWQDFFERLPRRSAVTAESAPPRSARAG